MSTTCTRNRWPPTTAPVPSLHAVSYASLTRRAQSPTFDQPDLRWWRRQPSRSRACGGKRIDGCMAACRRCSGLRVCHTCHEGTCHTRTAAMSGMPQLRCFPCESETRLFLHHCGPVTLPNGKVRFPTTQLAWENGDSLGDVSSRLRGRERAAPDKHAPKMMTTSAGARRPACSGVMTS